MNDEERKKLTMFENVITYLLENKDIILSNSLITQTIPRLRKIIDEIKLRDRELSSNTLEKTIVADYARQDLIFSILPISNSLFCFAKENADIGLKQKTRLSQSQLFRLKENELINKSSTIQYYATSILPRLHKFGITKNMIQKLNMKTEQFKNALDKKITSFVSNNTVVSLSASFLAAEKIIETQLDELVETYIDEYEEFYDEYQEIRSMENNEELEEELEIETEE